MENQDTNSDNNQIIQSKSVIEMLTIANEYCVFLEKADDYKKHDILEFVSRMGSLMYLKGSLLPDITVNYPEANERFVNEESWEVIFTSLRNKMGGNDEFFISGTDGINENQILKASVSELLSDVYQDMKDFVYLYQKASDASKENAVNEVKKLYKSHWGILILQAQVAVHNILYTGQFIQEEKMDIDFL